MDIFVCSRAEIEAGLVVRSDYVVISIRDPSQPPAKVKAHGRLRGVLHVAFHDADPSRFPLPPEIQPLTPACAAQIRDFVRQHQAAMGTLVIHCEQGMSRSPAVAAAVSQALGLDSRRFFQLYTPNPHVYHTVLDAFE